MPDTANWAETDGHRQVTLGDQLAARRGRYAVDAGDHWLRQARYGHHHVAALRKELLVISFARMSPHLLKVMSGAEGWAVACEHHHTYRVILGYGIECRLEHSNQFLRQRIELPGTVEGKRGNAVYVVA
jgi:hypothetical protein